MDQIEKLDLRTDMKQLYGIIKRDSNKENHVTVGKTICEHIEDSGLDFDKQSLLYLFMYFEDILTYKMPDAPKEFALRFGYLLLNRRSNTFIELLHDVVHLEDEFGLGKQTNYPKVIEFGKQNNSPEKEASNLKSSIGIVLYCLSTNNQLRSLMHKRILNINYEEQNDVQRQATLFYIHFTHRHVPSMHPRSYEIILQGLEDSNKFVQYEALSCIRSISTIVESCVSGSVSTLIDKILPLIHQDHYGTVDTAFRSLLCNNWKPLQRKLKSIFERLVDVPQEKFGSSLFIACVDVFRAAQDHDTKTMVANFFMKSSLYRKHAGVFLLDLIPYVDANECKRELEQHRDHVFSNLDIAAKEGKRYYPKLCALLVSKVGVGNNQIPEFLVPTKQQDSSKISALKYLIGTELEVHIKPKEIVELALNTGNYVDERLCFTLLSLFPREIQPQHFQIIRDALFRYAEQFGKYPHVVMDLFDVLALMMDKYDEKEGPLRDRIFNAFLLGAKPYNPLNHFGKPCTIESLCRIARKDPNLLMMEKNVLEVYIDHSITLESLNIEQMREYGATLQHMKDCGCEVQARSEVVTELLRLGKSESNRKQRVHDFFDVEIKF